MTIHILYHANCYDGFGAAYAAWKKFGNVAIYTAMAYGDPLPILNGGDIVFMLDYSRKRAEMEQIAAVCFLTIIDHHKTAQSDLEGLQGADNVVFNMEKSGAVLSWEFFHPGKKVPIILKHIQDRDLWRFEREWTKEIHAALCATAFNFQVWDEIIQGVEHYDDFTYGENLRMLVSKGRNILDYHDLLTDRFCEQVTMMDIGGYRVPVVNVSMLFSEVPHKLLSLYPDAPFAAYRYYRANGVVQVGLRGRDSDDFDVSEVAKKLGGGGHKKSAGYEFREEVIKP